MRSTAKLQPRCITQKNRPIFLRPNNMPVDAYHGRPNERKTNAMIYIYMYLGSQDETELGGFDTAELVGGIST